MFTHWLFFVTYENIKTINYVIKSLKMSLSSYWYINILDILLNNRMKIKVNLLVAVTVTEWVPFENENDELVFREPWFFCRRIFLPFRSFSLPTLLLLLLFWLLLLFELVYAASSSLLSYSSLYVKVVAALLIEYCFSSRLWCKTVW